MADTREAGELCAEYVPPKIVRGLTFQRRLRFDAHASRLGQMYWTPLPGLPFPYCPLYVALRPSKPTRSNVSPRTIFGGTYSARNSPAYDEVTQARRRSRLAVRRSATSTYGEAGSPSERSATSTYEEAGSPSDEVPQAPTERQARDPTKCHKHLRKGRLAARRSDTRPHQEPSPAR